MDRAAGAIGSPLPQVGEELVDNYRLVFLSVVVSFSSRGALADLLRILDLGIDICDQVDLHIGWTLLMLLREALCRIGFLPPGDL